MATLDRTSTRLCLIPGRGQCGRTIEEWHKTREFLLKSLAQSQAIAARASSDAGRDGALSLSAGFGRVLQHHDATWLSNWFPHMAGSA